MSTTQKKIKLPTMDFPFTVKQISEDLGTFEGHAATWAIDLQKDRIPPGAFARTLREAKADMAARDGKFLFMVCWMHDVHNPIGAIYEAYEDSVGLAVKGMLDLDIPEGRRAFSALKKGYVNSFSIGYKPSRHHMEAAKGIPGGIRVLDEIELIEVSIVSFPANPAAMVTNVKMARDAWFESLVNDMKRTAERIGAKRRSNGMSDFDDAAFGTRTGYTKYDEPQAPYRIEPGKHPEESRVEFNKELRAQLRAEDDELYTLHGKAFDREVERRRQQREEKQRLQREALEAERKAQADARIEPLEEYTPQRFTDKVGLDLVWFTRFLEACTARDEITPVMEGTMVFKGADLMELCRRHHEDIEQQAIRANHKRAERLAREGKAA